MNNRELENYFSPFSKKGLSCVGLLYKRESQLGMLSVSTETTQERQQMLQEDQRRAVFLCEYKYKIQHQGKMEFSLILIILVCGTSAVSIMPELKHIILRFGYGVNFRYEGMLSHSFDRFYVAMKIEIPKVLDLNLTLFQFDYNCSHVVNIEKCTNFKIPSTIRETFNVYCKNIIPYMYLYKHQVEYYEKTVYDILKKI